MYNKQQHGFCSEFYILEKTIEVVVRIKGEDERVKIDALKDEMGKYSTKSYIEEHVTLQPTYPQTHGTFDKAPRDYRIWLDYDLPWTHRNTADDALNQALWFLKERCSD